MLYISDILAGHLDILMWRSSSMGGTEYTRIDGRRKEAVFDCRSLGAARLKPCTFEKWSGHVKGSCLIKLINR
jgi:hypothetical protein